MKTPTLLAFCLGSGFFAAACVAMKHLLAYVQHLLAILALALATACAHRQGSTYAGGQIQTTWSHTTLGTDIESEELSAEGFKLARQNQSTVGNQVVKTAGTLGTAAITAGLLEGINASNNGVTTNASGNARAAAESREKTKRILDSNRTRESIFKTGVEAGL